MRRINKGLAALTSVALAFTIAACGEEKSGSTETKAADPASLSAELTWWDTSDAKNEGPAFQELIANFNKTYPNVKINYQSVPFAEAQNKFKTAAAAKTGAPDILRAEVAWVPEFASLGYLYSLDGSELLADESDYLAAPMESNKFDGKTYGVPQVTDSLALLYNKELVQKAGIEVPKTWAELKTAAQAVKQKTGVDGLYVNAAGYFALPFMYGEGGDLVDTTGKKIVVNSEQNVAGLNVAKDLIASGASVKPSATDSYGTMMTLFKEKKVAFIVNGPWEVNNIKTAPAFGGVENLGIAPVPAGSAKAGAPIGGHNYVIWSGVPQEKAAAAVAFVKFLNSAESQAFLAGKLGLLPTRKSAYDVASVKSNAVVSAFKPVAEAAVSRPWIPEGGQFFGPLDQMATEVLIQNKDAKASLDAVAKKYKAEVVPSYATN
ncbi:arabinogalactan oligomer/maltooligosaccharide transport system substrate-binding protein [Actinoplanes campanulatus]|uniref:Arabinogalactan oligomer/maltooligosaccharide transport system substrate-binding protein n=1 Tax=Actinoplanes campanulatus TaxID=113559 RepID=A0A7W5FJE3_9ACTN|nr:extracellular solute-binding protein [Actinoplanes campanulatus]MBB3100542.1 arabinogalactan oligomer/maltooligosaccharide transport system substrate-binding protein [Actinoplanes campanulatus]GGN45250.1 sugar ABC transporter substrate-binding protein [Actinoplanes campanulatus]GID41027.1 sugar ABC transporter substrate-binding protein [Actinoplanes campanulatus]